MKLRSNKQKRTTTILIGVGIAVLIAAIVLAIVLLIPKNNDSGDQNLDPMPLAILGINVAQCGKTTYQVGEQFDPSSIKIQVVMTDQSKSYFVDGTNSKLTFSGFDSSVPNDNVVITVTFKEFTTSFYVKVEEPEPEKPAVEVVSIELVGGYKTTYTLTEWKNGFRYSDDASLVCTYSDGTTKTIPMRKNYIEQPNFNLSGPCDYDITITYEGVSTVITLTITE